MAKLLMITGRGSAVDLASGKRGAFYSTLEEFHKYWDRIDIITPKVKYPVPDIFGNVYIHSSPWPLLFHPVFFIRKSLEIYRQQKFDLMTVQEFPPFYNGIAARLIWNRIKTPYVLEIFHITGYPKAASLKEKIYRWLFYFFIKYDCRKAKAVRVMNNQVAEKLASLGVPESKINLIPAIYIDLNVFKPMDPVRGPIHRPESAETGRFLTSNGVDFGKKYDLIFIGRLVKNKGIDLLLKAIEFSIFNFQFSIKCLIVGDGPLKESLKFKIKSLKLENNIIFYGWAKDQTEVAKLLNMSKILVMPSYNEGGPRVVPEAMACGVPVLAAPVGIVPDLVDGSQIIDWRPDDIAEKAQSLLSNSQEYQRCRERGLSVVKRFERKTAIKNYADGLKGILLD